MLRPLPFLFLATAAIAQTQNVMLVVADDVGVDSVACYGLGSNPPPTPTIDGLAAAGVRFTNAQACPLCSPTRASLLTGRHGFRTGIGRALANNDAGLAATETLLPEVLAPAGIHTALIGKWHLGDDLGAATPTAEGFGLFTGALQGALNNYFNWPKVENGTTSLSTTYATTDCVDEALAFVGSTSQPWFLMLAFHAGHTPLHAPPAGLHTQNLTGLDPQTTPVPFYKAMVEAMDTELGRLLATMPPAVRANTNIVFLGDNGTASQVVQAPFDPQRSKGTVYQGGVKVPLIV
ncbi:MAG: sulfatase-like hydrolase/transferase, partial [Planctomycetes bacterium]|nr:sulfatase-like hydrolase/transferase [Planctomycetota bacterium]